MYFYLESAIKKIKRTIWKQLKNWKYVIILDLFC